MIKIIICERGRFHTGRDDGWLSRVHHAAPRPPSQQTRYIGPMFFYCWASVADDGQTLKQHWDDILCLLGYCSSGNVSRGRQVREFKSLATKINLKALLKKMKIREF